MVRIPRIKDLTVRAFLALDAVGIHVVPKHYYTPIADRAWLRSHQHAWQRPLSLDRLTYWNLDDQLAWLERICGPYLDEIQGELGIGIGPGYGPIEAQILYCFVRVHAPARIVEIGGGTSTTVMSRAALRNRDEGRVESHLTVIEPNPARELEMMPDIEIVRSGCQELEPSFVTKRLGKGDLLFIDSSHAVKTGSELSHLYLSVIPSLPAGVVVHVHDVFFPYLYAPTVLHDYFDWQETTLLAGLLAGNNRLRPLCSGSALHHSRSADLAAILPDYRPAVLSRGLTNRSSSGHFPAVFWMETCESVYGDVRTDAPSLTTDEA